MSKTEKPENPIDPGVAEIIARKARRLVGRAGFQYQDCEDIEQELTLRLLANLSEMMPLRDDRLPLVQWLVDRFASNLLRHRRAAKRNGGPHAPLTAAIPAPDTEDLDRVHDVTAALARLPPDLRAVAELLLTRSVSETAKALGVARSTIYARLRELANRPEFADFLADF